MKISRLATLSLALAVAIFALGYVNPSFAHKTGMKHNHGGDGDGDGGATFTVEVFFDGDSIGIADDAQGKTHGKRRTVSVPDLELDLSSLNDDLPDGCAVKDSLGDETAQFALTTYQNRHGDFTFVTASFNFDPLDTGVNYALEIGPPEDGNVADDGTNWLPGEGDTTSVFGERVGFVLQKDSNADDPCNGELGIVWIIDVTGN